MPDKKVVQVWFKREQLMNLTDLLLWVGNFRKAHAFPLTEAQYVEILQKFHKEVVKL